MMNTWVQRARTEHICAHAMIVSICVRLGNLCNYVNFQWCAHRKWRPPETDEEKEKKKQRAEEAKKRKKEKADKSEKVKDEAP